MCCHWLGLSCVRRGCLLRHCVWGLAKRLSPPLSFVQVEAKKAEPRDSKAPGHLGPGQWGPRGILSTANGWTTQPAQGWQQTYGPQGEWEGIPEHREWAFLSTGFHARPRPSVCVFLLPFPENMILTLNHETRNLVFISNLTFTSTHTL